MNSDCIVTQVHIPDFDVQGGLPYADKLHLVQYGLKHLRLFNPNSYIILSGHGHRPDERYYDYCDHVMWDDQCHPLDEHGYVLGMPAQFKYIARGIKHAASKGFTHCLKTRGDCIIGIPNITEYCNNILNTENKRLLITQQTGPSRLGDCFMFGNIDLLYNTWHEDNPVTNNDGLQNTANNFLRALGIKEQTDWLKLLRSHCSFRDVNTLKFMCLRWSYFQLARLNDTVCEELHNPEYDFAKYHWGSTNGRHSFDTEGNMTSSDGNYWSAKQFYAESSL